MYQQGKCVYLHGLVEELIEEQGQCFALLFMTHIAWYPKIEPHPDKLSQKHLDRIIVARLSLDPNEPHEELPKDIADTLNITHFDYLLNCWKQAYDIRKNTLIRSKVMLFIFLAVLTLTIEY